MKRILAMAGLIAGLTAPGWVGGAAVTDEEISAADAQAIHVAVQAQLDAFAEDDAVGAFQLATTDTQTRIGTPDKFLYLGFLPSMTTLGIHMPKSSMNTWQKLKESANDIKTTGD